MAENDPAPDNTSSAYDATLADRTVVRDMLTGLSAIQAKGETYLTKWPQETTDNYNRRLDDACFTPLFSDLMFGLTSKPFTKDVALKEGASARIEALTEDIDGQGNNLSVFARRVFNNGVADGMAAILVDYPQNPGTRTRADEAQANLRPYFVGIEYADLLALYTEVIGGVETITHARIREVTVERQGFEEVTVNRVRVLEPGIWQLWEASEAADRSTNWMLIAEGTTTLSYVPLVPIYFGERMGAQYVKPPLVNLAHMQVELFRQENNLKSIEIRAAFPMLAANGMSPPTDGNSIRVGPMGILFGGEGGSWEVLEPQGSSLQHLKARIEETKQEMRRLGMQPLLPGTGSAVTATASSIEASKAHSAVQMWAMTLKDGLEAAFVMMADWLREPPTVEVMVHTDFNAGVAASESITALLALKQDGSISRRATLEEMKRHGVLSPDYDIDADQEEIDAEREAMMATLPDVMPSQPGQPQPDPGDELVAGFAEAAAA